MQQELNTVAAEATVARLVTDWTRAKTFTQDYLDAMPIDGINFCPTEGTRTFAEQMLHLAAINFAFISAVAEIPNPYNKQNIEKMPEFTSSKEALSKLVMESYDFAINTAPKLDLGKMNENIKLFGAFDMSRGAALDKAFEHQTHHRGQVTIYLRMKGAKTPNQRLF